MYKTGKENKKEKILINLFGLELKKMIFLEFYSVKLEKESKENKFHKFIWLRGGENNFLGFYKV